MGLKKPHIDWPRTIAGALAAVAAAVVLSKLGVVGTLTGAAIGSLVISIGTNVGAHGISSTRQRMLEAQREAARRVSLAQAEVRRARAAGPQDAASQERLAQADDALESSKSELAEDVPTSEVPVVDPVPAPDEPLPRVIVWRRVAIFTAASFVIALLAITAFELIGGRPLSALMGDNNDKGTSLFPDTGRGSSPKPNPTPSATPTQATSPSTSPSPTPTVTITVTPTPSVSPTPSPSATPTPSDTTTPSTSPTASNTP